MFWTPIERDWLAEQLLAILPRPEMKAAVKAGVPELLEAMPWPTRLGLRALVWWVAAAGRRGVGPVLARWERDDRWVLREVATTLKVMAALVWEADRVGPRSIGWGEGPPVILPERRKLLEAPSMPTFLPEEVE
jgi:hypothetical protein